MADFSEPEGILNFVKSLDFPYFPGGIFPSEMALFLHHCEKTGVECIIESGRGEGYSTAVIAAYAQARQVQVLSTDFEAHPDIARRCRERLARYPNIVTAHLVVSKNKYSAKVVNPRDRYLQNRLRNALFYPNTYRRTTSN